MRVAYRLQPALPVRLPELRRILQSIVMIGLPLAGCTDDPIEVSGDGPFEPVEEECGETYDRTLTLTSPAEPALQFRIEGCRVDVDKCMELCSDAARRAEIWHSLDACDVEFEGDTTRLAISYTVFCGEEGRRPAGLVPAQPDASSPIGAWLAQAAWLEDASVYAFAHLAAELTAHGAPLHLARAAVIAARDEVRHLELMTRLALRYGTRPVRAEVALPAVRSLEELAAENATEGCVRETMGAVMALFQSQHALDPEARAVFAVIARDEARHAALAWAVDAWVMPLLSDEARARVLQARAQGAATLAVEYAASSPDPRVARALGLPVEDFAQTLVTRAQRSLWG